jgi:ligand-binding sensor domain-containing protein
MKKLLISSLFLLRVSIAASQGNGVPVKAITDEHFLQEYHEGFVVGSSPEENEVRSIAVDDRMNVWIATAAGIFMKAEGKNSWSDHFQPKDKGPAYAVCVDKDIVWMGTWKGVFCFRGNALEFVPGTSGPISAVCTSREGIYALGPDGIWLFNGKTFQKTNYAIARSVRNAISDNSGGIWVTSDVGLYHCTKGKVKLFQSTNQLLSASVKDMAIDRQNKLWVGGLGGVTIIANEQKQKTITTAEGCPSIFVTAVKRSPDNVMWVGSKVGVVRFYPDGKHSLLFSRRWLLDA